MAGIKLKLNTKITDQNVNSISTCLFCNSQAHTTPMCDVYSSREARQKQLTSQCRCTTCCKKHPNNCCNTKIKPCYNCKGDHHTWLCNQRPQKAATNDAGETTSVQVWEKK